jgi:hypothetical protein
MAAVIVHSGKNSTYVTARAQSANCAFHRHGRLHFRSTLDALPCNRRRRHEPIFESPHRPKPSFEAGQISGDEDANQTES